MRPTQPPGLGKAPGVAEPWHEAEVLVHYEQDSGLVRDPHALDPAPGVQMEFAEITGADGGDPQDFGHWRVFPRGLPAGPPPIP